MHSSLLRHYTILAYICSQKCLGWGAIVTQGFPLLVLSSRLNQRCVLSAWASGGRWSTTDWMLLAHRLTSKPPVNSTSQLINQFFCFYRAQNRMWLRVHIKRLKDCVCNIWVVLLMFLCMSLNSINSTAGAAGGATWQYLPLIYIRRVLSF